MELEILYQDDYLVAINKPHGLFVHRTKLDKEATEFALQMLRDQLQKRVTPIHRIDRKTSGILLFSFDNDVLKSISQQFESHTINKEYHALVRGYIKDKGVINYALTNDCGKIQEALTTYEIVNKYEIPVPLGKHKTSRYSLVKLFPKTGRYHQIRKHLGHIRYPIIGDRPHGCNKQNKLFKDTWDITNMMLTATKLSFHHPILDKEIVIESPLSDEFTNCVNLLEKLKL